MKRSFLLPLLVLGLFFAPDVNLPSAGAQQAIELRIATLAPDGSSWMRVFNAWNTSLRQATNNRLSLRFYAGGSQGDERDFVRKMRAGQMDGAVVTTTGLGIMVRSALVLATPGLITEYAQLDRVRQRLASTFDQQFTENGYKLLGWGDAGQMRLFSVDRIQRPSELASHRPWVWRDDPVYTEYFQAMNANPVRLGVPEVLPGLQTRMVDSLFTSAIAGVSLQWHTRTRFASRQTFNILVGATVISKQKFDSLPPDLQQALVDTAQRAHLSAQRLIQRDDANAFNTVQQRGVQVNDLGSHYQEWMTAARTARERLAGRVYPRALLDQVTQAMQ